MRARVPSGLRGSGCRPAAPLARLRVSERDVRTFFMFRVSALAGLLRDRPGCRAPNSSTSAFNSAPGEPPFVWAPVVGLISECLSSWHRSFGRCACSGPYRGEQRHENGTRRFEGSFRPLGSTTAARAYALEAQRPRPETITLQGQTPQDATHFCMGSSHRRQA
jgi:hypothetical protein